MIFAVWVAIFIESRREFTLDGHWGFCGRFSLFWLGRVAGLSTKMDFC